MNWEQKLLALQAIQPEVALHIRSSGSWYVSGLIEIGGDGFLKSPTQGGATPQAAVEECWDQYVTNLPADRYLVVNRKRYRWNGFMWKSVTE